MWTTCGQPIRHCGHILNAAAHGNKGNRRLELYGIGECGVTGPVSEASHKVARRKKHLPADRRNATEGRFVKRGAAGHQSDRTASISTPSVEVVGSGC